MIWAYSRAHGLPSDIVREVISSDSFFVKSEWSRYTLAREVVELRRRGKDAYVDDEASDETSFQSQREEMLGAYNDDDDLDGISEGKASTASPYGKDRSKTKGVSRAENPLQALHSPETHEHGFLRRGLVHDSDELEYSELFARGVYYTHMSFSELSAIAEDVSPSTGTRFVPEPVLQKALWTGMEFRNTISSSDMRPVDPALLADDSQEPLPTGLTPREDALCDLHLASDLEEFRQDFFAGTSLPSSSNGDSSFRSPRGLRRGETPSSITGSPGAKSGMRRPSNMNLGSEFLAGGLSKKAMLDKRYFPVPTDDTLRLGDSLGSLPSAVFHMREGVNSLDYSAYLSDTAGATIGASGLAALKDPFTLSVPSTRRAHLFGSRANGGADGHKSLADYFGIADASRTGRQLAEKSAAACGPQNDATANVSFTAPHFSMDDHIHSQGDNDNEAAAKSSDTGKQEDDREMWLPYEPMRIGVDFWGVDKLPERNRLYSPTFFYAGSLWNLYVQTIRKPKGVQLGIYLHRQNPAEPLPPASAAPSEAAAAAANTAATGMNPRVSAPSLDQLLNESLNLNPAGLHSDTIGGTPRQSRGAYGSSLSGAGGSGDEQPPTIPPVMPAMPYRDPRKGIRAFFSIHCPSPFGNAMTRFSSGPDQFTLSQSWGWKSSSLLGTVYLADGHVEDVRSESANRFRCVCTIGLV